MFVGADEVLMSRFIDPQNCKQLEMVLAELEPVVHNPQGVYKSLGCGFSRP